MAERGLILTDKHGGGEEPDKPGEASPSRGHSWRFDIAWIGAAGTALYVVLRFPYAIFYAKLGTSPEELGLGYTQTLIHSSVAIAIVFGTVAMAIALSTALTPHHGRMEIELGKGHIFRPAVQRRYLAKMNDAAFNAHMARVRKYWSQTEYDRELYENEAPLRSRLRELDRTKNRGPNGDREAEQIMHDLNSQSPSFRKSIRNVSLLAFALCCLPTLLGGLPALASTTADSVRLCREGISFVGFELGGRHVQLLDGASMTDRFPDRELLLLGGDSSKYVLYDCRNLATLRVPTSGYVVVQPGH